MKQKTNQSFAVLSKLFALLLNQEGGIEDKAFLHTTVE